MLNLPNSLTLLRILLAPILVVILLTKFEDRELWGAVVFLAASATDFLDGYFARKRGQVTTLGKLLDPIADKLLISAAFISLVEENLADAWMVVIIIGREFAVMGLRSIASSQSITIAASIWGKYKMISQTVAILLLILGNHPWGPYSVIGNWAQPLGKFAMYVVVVLAVLSAVDYFVKFSRVFVPREET